MKLLYTLIILSAFSFGQYGKDFTEGEKHILYNQATKSSAIGVISELFIPTLGYAYMGDWKRGLKIKAAHLISSVAIGGSVFFIYDYTILDSPTNFGDSSGYVSMWISYGLLQVFILFDVDKEIKKHNHRTFKQIFGKELPSFSLNLQPTYQGANLNLSYAIK
jgi:hypothetical protein